ncbi:hypothetical protein LV779_31875 [Streptomyces thinghirensis]|nr:hypothetical protein [Streptomyces thinghirensis]
MSHITLVNCSETWEHQDRVSVWTTVATASVSKPLSQAGWTLNPPDAYGVWTEEHPVEATLTAQGEETVINAPTNDYQPVGEAGDTGLRSVLVELRVTG